MLNTVFMNLEGTLGALTKRISKYWLTDLRQSNPAILDMFKDADRPPYRFLLPWSGEFAGKHLTASVLIYRVTQDAELLKAIGAFTEELYSCQQSDGYLGPFPQGHHLLGTNEAAGFSFDKNFEKQAFGTWDAWGHYHIMTGLLYWYDLKEDERAMECCRRIADLFLRTFYGEGQPTLHDTGVQEMNLAPLHSFCRLYQHTKEQKYLDFAFRVLEDIAKPPAGDYLHLALAGVEFFEMPKPRWESLHAIEGLVSLYEITGEEQYKTAAVHIWASISKTDVHNTGGFSTNEQATGNPYDSGPIETCCTVAYMALSVDIARITGNLAVYDMLENSTYNASMASFSPSGRWSTYDTPMYGYKRANYDSIHFQCRPGSPDLNCCSVNAPRALGMVSEWAYQVSENTVTCAFYGAHTAKIETPSGTLSLDQITEYPYDGKVTVHVLEAPAQAVTLRLRIPGWCSEYSLQINGIKTDSQRVDGFHKMTRMFEAGDKIEIQFHMGLSAWIGEHQQAGTAALYRGPLLLCYDPFYDFEYEPESLPQFRADRLKEISAECIPGKGLCVTCSDGEYQIVLCDLYSAGVAGTPYHSWIPIKNMSEKNPLPADLLKRYSLA